MKINLSSLTFLLVLFAAISCSDDSSNTPFSDLNGQWAGETIIGNDTARYSCEVTETNKVIKGDGKLYGYHKTQHGGMTVTDQSRREASVVGTFDRPNIGIKFDGDAVNHFEGQLSEDKMSINGLLSIRFTMTDSLIAYPIVLNK